MLAARVGIERQLELAALVPEAQRDGISFALIFFEMAAMPFPCIGLLLCCVNLPECFSINLLVVLSLISIFF